MQPNGCSIKAWWDSSFTIDFQKLNAQCPRDTHYTALPFPLASKIPLYTKKTVPHTKKTVIDAVDGHHSVAVDPESQPLTTFMKEWCRYMYLCMRQGFVAARDAYTHWYNAITVGALQKVKIVDDAHFCDVSIEEHFFHAWTISLSAQIMVLL